jgi:hypothetical protein
MWMCVEFDFDDALSFSPAHLCANLAHLANATYQIVKSQGRVLIAACASEGHSCDISIWEVIETSPSQRLSSLTSSLLRMILSKWPLLVTTCTNLLLLYVYNNQKKSD